MTGPGLSRTDTIERAQQLDALIDQLVGPRVKPEPHAPARRVVHRVLACIGETDATTTNVLSWTSEVGRLFGPDVTLIHVTRYPASPVLYPAGPLGLGAPAVVPLPGGTVDREASERLLQDARSALSLDLADVGILHREGHPGDEIVRAARELASDLIIIGHHEGGAIDRFLLGSTTDHVKNHAHADVLIARTPVTPGPIVAAIDGSPPSRHAAHLADSIARRWGTTLRLLHVVPRMSRASDDAAQARAAMELAHARPVDGVTVAIKAGDPREAIRLAAREADASLTAVGARGASGLRSLMPGSVSNSLAHSGPTSLLIARDEASRS